MTRQLALPLPHDAAMGPDDFLIAESNREAAAFITAWPDWPAHGMIVTGSSGSGKTHLLHLWLAQSGATLLSVEGLTSPTATFLDDTDVCFAIDDVDTAAGNSEAEEALFHLYNHLRAAKGSLLLTMKGGAGQAGFILPDLRSRLLTLPAVALGAPDDELLAALIVKQFRDRQIALDAGVVSYLTTRGARDTASLRNLIDRLDKASLAEGRKISVALTRKIMEMPDA